MPRTCGNEQTLDAVMFQLLGCAVRNRGEDRTHPSSKSRKLVADPESLDMKTMVRIGTRVARSLWAVMMGPIVLVRRW
jgi:hypothetical protein